MIQISLIEVIDSMSHSLDLLGIFRVRERRALKNEQVIIREDTRVLLLEDALVCPFTLTNGVVKVPINVLFL